VCVCVEDAATTVYVGRVHAILHEISKVGSCGI